jgi:hypothetical protein
MHFGSGVLGGASEVRADGGAHEQEQLAVARAATLKDRAVAVAAAAGRAAVAYGPFVAVMLYGLLRTQPRPTLKDFMHL